MLVRIPYGSELLAHAEFRNHPLGELRRTLNIVSRTRAVGPEHHLFGSPASHHHPNLVFELFDGEQVPVLLGHLHRVPERPAAAWDDADLADRIAGRDQARSEERR